MSHVGARRAVPEVGDLAQVLRQVVLVLRLRRQLHVPAEGVQPHRVGPARGEEQPSGQAKSGVISNPIQSLMLRPHCLLLPCAGMNLAAPDPDGCQTLPVISAYPKPGQDWQRWSHRRKNNIF